MTGAQEDLPTVLFVVTPAQMGGSNRSMVTLLQTLEGRVNRVLASPTFGSFREVAEADRLADEFLDLPRKPGSPFDRLLRVAAGAKIAWWVFRRRRVLTAIHANALTGLNMAVFGAIIHRGSTVVWIHDPVSSKWGGRLGPIVRRLIPALKIAAVSRVAEAVAVENGLCEAGASHLVPNPIDSKDVVAPRAERSDDRLTIGVLGGATHRKGFDLIPDTIEHLGSNGVRWSLFVSSAVSPGMEDTWERIGRFGGNRVEVHDKVFDVATVYQQMDIVFCPSRNESFCRVAAEAMINGIPVVGSDIEPLRNLIGNDEAGFVFANQDPKLAADALQRLVEDPELRSRMGRSGRRRSEAFRPETIAAQLLDLYQAGPAKSAHSKGSKSAGSG
jgi:glycosyltransferase involved in cell wall biosynthesis